MTISTHRHTVQVGSVVVPCLGGRISLDAGRAPHVKATLTLPVSVMDLLDPRTPTRVRVLAAAETPTGTQNRVFNLGLRRRPVRHSDGQISVELASDERLLDDYRPLADDPAPTTRTTIRRVVRYVLNRVLPGVVLQPGPDAPAVGVGAADDALLWRAGRSAMEFLAPLVQAAGLRLVCDETRTWTLRSEIYTGLGAPLTIGYGTDLIDGGDTIDRDADVWFDAAVTRYRWTVDGVQHEQVDAYALTGDYSKAVSFERSTPYPGSGFSQYAVRRARSRGREVTVTRVNDWDTRAEQPVIVTLPETPVQVGAIQTVEFNVDTDEMTVTARTIDTPATAWILLPAGQAWNDSPSGASWTEETA